MKNRSPAQIRSEVVAEIRAIYQYIRAERGVNQTTYHRMDELVVYHLHRRQKP